MNKAAAQRSWESLSVGERGSLEKHISPEDIAAFAALSGDENPLHVKDGIVHGMYLGALFSALVGMQLPGDRALLVKESLSFKKPVRAGDTVTLTAAIAHKSEATRILDLAITIEVQGELVARGEAQVQVRI